jgi:hypothetical protein
MRRFLGKLAPSLAETGHMRGLEQLHSILRACVLSCITTWSRHLAAWKSVWKDQLHVVAAIRMWGRRVIGVAALTTWAALAAAIR